MAALSILLPALAVAGAFELCVIPCQDRGLSAPWEGSILGKKPLSAVMAGYGSKEQRILIVFQLFPRPAWSISPPEPRLSCGRRRERQK